MTKVKVKVKGIVKSDNKYLVVKRWYDDRIPDPFQWEFVDGDVEFGEHVDDAVLRLIEQNTGITATIERILYTWSQMIGEIQCIGIAYLCGTNHQEICLNEELGGYEWIKKEEFPEYIENQFVLGDLEKVEI